MSSHSPLRRTSVRSAVEHLERLLLEGDGVAVDLLRVEHRAQRGAPGGVPHPAGEVADDQHHVVARVLELAQLLEHHRVSEVDVRRRGVDAQLHPQRPAFRGGALELSLQLAPGQRIDGVSLQEFRGFDWDLSRFFARRPMLDSRLRSGWP